MKTEKFRKGRRTPMFHYTVETNRPVNEAIASLEQNLKNEGFGVLWHLDLQAKLQEKGLGFG
jgi:uncharacterized protein (DUF302 family)